MEVRTTEPEGGRRIHGLNFAERQLERRGRLLEAALEVFASKGYWSVTVDQICTAASVSTKSFYVDFENKEELFLALYGDLLDGAVSQIAAATFDSDLDEDGRTRRRITAFVHACVDDRRVARLMFLEAAGVSPKVEARRREAHHLFARAIELSTVPRVANGVLPERNYHRAALAIVGGVNEVLVDWVLDPDPDPVDEVIDEIIEVFLLVRDSLQNMLRDGPSKRMSETVLPTEPTAQVESAQAAAGPTRRL